MNEKDSSGTTSDSHIDPAFVAMLCCPCPERRRLEQRDQGLCCTGCERKFPIVDGIPRIMLDQHEEPQD
ncbi:MAG TPA: hypothetical protein EYO84_05765 [Planctomycetes bacterium]|nr:hypothetical protein [Planctomycetota bacterium]